MMAILFSWISIYYIFLMFNYCVDAAWVIFQVYQLMYVQSLNKFSSDFSTWVQISIFCYLLEDRACLIPKIGQIFSTIWGWSERRQNNKVRKKNPKTREACRQNLCVFILTQAHQSVSRRNSDRKAFINLRRNEKRWKNRELGFWQT